MTHTRTMAFNPETTMLAAGMIQQGQVVAVPTETVYGLAGDARNADAVAAISAAKGRPDFNPLIVHVANIEMARQLAHFTELAERLAVQFWPGALTMVLPLREDAGLAPAVRAGLPTVALRMPAHAAMQALIHESGAPLAAPSANASGGISPTSAAHVLRSLGGRIPLVIDGGTTAQGLESTIIAPETDRIRLLRPGPVTAEMLDRASGLPVTGSDGRIIEAPGQLASHYAPGKPLRLNATSARIDEYLIGFGAMACDTNLSETGNLEQAASRLFAALHMADMSTQARIAVAPVPQEGIGIAINDRLIRAAA